MKKIIANRSKIQGFSRSRLPEFTEEEKEYIKNTYDFIGVNCYTGSLAAAIDQPDMETRDWSADSQVHDYQPDDWPSAASSWLKVRTNYFLSLLLFVITECLVYNSIESRINFCLQTTTAIISNGDKGIYISFLVLPKKMIFLFVFKP